VSHSIGRRLKKEEKRRNGRRKTHFIFPNPARFPEEQIQECDKKSEEDWTEVVPQILTRVS
jgi:hypothetical protein